MLKFHLKTLISSSPTFLFYVSYVKEFPPEK